MLFIAGGHATYLHIDHVRKMIPSNILLYGFADAGYVEISHYHRVGYCVVYRYFLDACNVNGEYVQRALLQAGILYVYFSSLCLQHVCSV